VRHIYLVAALLAGVVTALAGCATTSPSSDNRASSEPPASTDQQPEVPAGRVSCHALERTGYQEAAERFGDVQLPVKATGPVAIVNDKEISARRFNQFVRTQVPRDMADGPQRPDGRDASGPFADMMEQANTQFLVDRLVTAEIMRQALDDADIFIDQDALDEEMTTYKQKKVPDDSDYESYLEGNMLTDAQVRAKVCRTLQRRQFVKSYDRSVTDDVIQAYYEANKDDFRQPMTLSGRIIIIKAGNDRSIQQARDTAQSLTDNIRAGNTTFKQAARQHSDGNRSKRGGRFETLKLDHFASETTDTIAQLELDEVSDPIRADVTIFGNTTTMFYVMRIEDRSPEKMLPLADVRDKIRNHLEQQAQAHPYRFVMDALTRKASIQTMPDNISRQ
jgi:hypothetical protein